MDEQNDAIEESIEYIQSKKGSNIEHQEKENPEEKTSPQMREQEITKNPCSPEDPKTSALPFYETDDIRIEPRHSNTEPLDKLETLREKLDQHPDLKRIDDFEEHYRRATIYFHVKDLKDQNEPESIPYKTLEELSQEIGIHTWTLRRWERNDTQPWLLHRINQREHSEDGKIEQHWHINSFEEFQSLLNRHPHLEERSTFTEQYHRIQQYYKFQALHKQGKLENTTTSSLAHRFGITWDTADLWRHEKSRPNLINVLMRHELARVQYESTFHLEAFYHLILPEEVYNAFKHLRTHNHPPIPEIATILEHIYRTNIENNPLLFFELTHYHEYGPKWLKHISKTIEKHQQELEAYLNQHAKPQETIRIGVVENNVYIWVRNTSPDNWLNLHRHEHFHFHTTQDKAKLIDTAHKHLALYNDQALSRLIGQITDYSEKIYKTNAISDLRRNRTIMEGEVLHFLLTTIGVDEKHVKPLLHHIGTETYPSSGRILNPKFPPIEPFRTQLYSTMISDGHLTKDLHLDYVEKRQGRIERVKNLISQLGNVEFQEYVNSGGVTKLSFPAVVGRLLEQWGFPIGDKTIQNPELPDYIKKGSKDIKVSYLREMVPEDGYFIVRKQNNSGLFGVNRSTALDAGNKTEMYKFTSLITQNEKQLIQDFGNQVMLLGRTPAYEVSWAKLKELIKNPSVEQTAKRLKYIIEENPNNLLKGEKQVCEDLGIKMRHHITGVSYYPASGRISIGERIQTRTNDDTIHWAIKAPPNDEYKSKKVKDWLQTQNYEEASLL